MRGNVDHCKTTMLHDSSRKACCGKRQTRYTILTCLQAFLYENDDRFFPGWKLDISWILCTVSWTVAFLLACGISAAAILLPSEAGYELIPDEEVFDED